MNHPQLYDDESILSGIYTESGDASTIAQQTFDAEDDDEAFRRAVQAEQGRVMREFGLIPSSSSASSNYRSHDVMSMEGEEDMTISDFRELQNETTTTTNRDIITSTDSYNEDYDQESRMNDMNNDDSVEDDDDASTFHPNLKQYPSLTTINQTKMTENSTTATTTTNTIKPILTPRRFRIIMALLCVILVGSVAVAVGSFLVAQQGGDDEKDSNTSSSASTTTNNDANNGSVPDLGNTSATPPTNVPTGEFVWNEGDCVDHPYQKFKINDRYGEQDCTFLRNHVDQRGRMCLSTNEGSRWCPVTCGLCLQPITEDPIDGQPSSSSSSSNGNIFAPSLAPIVVYSPTILPSMEGISSTSTTAPTRTPTVAPVILSTSTPTLRPTKQPIVEKTLEPTEPIVIMTAEPTPWPTVAPTIDDTIPIATSAPSTESSNSFFCRTCPFMICNVISC